MPELAIPGLADKMAFAREDDHFGRDALALQCCEHLQALGNRNAEVEFAVDDEHRRFEILRE